MIYKKYTNENYNLYTIKTDKFKSCLMEVVFSKPLDKSKVTIDNFLVENLGYTCKKYPKRKNMVEKLEDLYAASCYSVTTKVGNVLFSNFILEFLDPKYCDKNYLKDVLELPFEMIFNPNITNNEFDIKTFNIIKNRIRASISSLKENATRYAIQESLKAMDKDSPSSINSIGYLKDLEEIEDEIIEKYGVKPIQLIEVKGLMGDTSDNIPGVPGIGPKTAVSLIQKYHSVKELYEKIEKDEDDLKGKQKENIVANKDMAELSRTLGEIDTNVPLEDTLENLKVEEWDKAKVLEIFEELRFQRYIDRFGLRTAGIVEQTEKENVFNCRIRQSNKAVRKDKAQYRL